MITHHTQLLNVLIEKYSLTSYLEIGVNNPANNFDKISCKIKTGVDPETNDSHIIKKTSDAFFANNEILFDIIFIDGLHHADQVKKDFENSLRCLTDNGVIVIHDCLPQSERTTHVPRDTKIWHGDVYKFCMQLRNYDGIEFTTYNIDHGCCVIKKKQTKKMQSVTINSNWETFCSLKKEVLNISDEVII